MKNGRGNIQDIYSPSPLVNLSVPPVVSSTPSLTYNVTLEVSQIYCVGGFYNRRREWRNNGGGWRRRGFWRFGWVEEVTKLIKIFDFVFFSLWFIVSTPPHTHTHTLTHTHSHTHTHITRSNQNFNSFPVASHRAEHSMRRKLANCSKRWKLMRKNSNQPKKSQHFSRAPTIWNQPIKIKNIDYSEIKIYIPLLKFKF